MRGVFRLRLVGRGLLLATAIACMSSPAAAQAEVPVQPYASNDAGGFRNVLPAGEGGLDNGTQLAEFEAKGTRPPHFTDQLPLYANLLYASPTLTNEQIPSYYKDATFGVKANDIASKESPITRTDVTIERDSSFGVPHIYGSTRAGVLFGAGYAAAQDRLFLIDVLRHLARAELSSFIGGAEGNRAMDRAEWLIAPYTEADLESQLNNAKVLYGAAGEQVVQDVKEFVAGINLYITETLNPNKMPAEYAAIGKSPAMWSPEDVIAEASLIGGIFGKGGGAEVSSALVVQAFEKAFGKKAGRAMWRDFREHNDPEAPVTVPKSFPYETTSPFSTTGLAMPAPGSVSFVKDGEVVAGGASPASQTSSTSGMQTTDTPAPQPVPEDGSIGSQLAGQLMTGLPHASNWELVNKNHSTNGHSLAVMGPQVGYFVPEILMEEDLHGPGFDARGAAFPGVNLYVELGHGRDYAWSATSAGSDNIDTFAEVLCQDEEHYMYKGQCVPMEKLEKTNTWTSNALDKTPPGSEKLTVFRTVHGIVYARGMVQKKKVAFASARTTYFHEADSAIGFSELNNPADMMCPATHTTCPQRFQEAVSKINFTFNWSYVDANNIAYYLSGAYPLRAPKTSPDFPILGTGEFDWQGFEPKLHTESLVPFAAHPNAINPTMLVSWNNKQAPGWSAADDNYSYGPIFRSQLIKAHIQADLAGGRKMHEAELVSAMDEAATEDIRTVKLWPIIRQVLGTPSSTQLQGAIAKLESWAADGGHRRDLTNKDISKPGTYQHNEAITIMDAWWPKLLQAEFGPVLGSGPFAAVQGILGFGGVSQHGTDDTSFASGWYGYVSKDLRDLLAANGLGALPKAQYSRIYCGNGSFEACQKALQTSLQEALSVTPAELYGHGECAGNAQASCFDMNRWTSVSGISVPPFPFQNRPTFQQTIELTQTLPR